MIAMLLLVVGITPGSDIVREQVDLVEVNHFYDDTGRHVFDQLIFYDWSYDDGRYQVLAWRLLKADSQLPRRDWKFDYHRSLWHDGEVFREIIARHCKESWTQYDPELAERDFLPKERRRELGLPVKRPSR